MPGRLPGIEDGVTWLVPQYWMDTTATEAPMWQQVIGQVRVVEALRRAIQSGRVAHAYLFHGPDGVGKRAVALAFAQALQCQQSDGTQADPCGQCNACHKVRHLLHPDVQVLFPYPNDAEPTDVAERLQRLAVNAYATVDFVRQPVLGETTKAVNKQASYKVEHINGELRRMMSFKPVEGRYKVVVLTDVELMRVEAANTFLKLLEEPNPQTLFLLTTSRPDLVLPTVLSRCQQVRFDRLPVEVLEQALVQGGHAQPSEAGPLARMADGSFSRACDLAENADLRVHRQQMVDFFRNAYTGHVEKLADQIEAFGQQGREAVKSTLGLMLGWVRDLMLYRALGEAAPLVNVDQHASVVRFCARLPDADLDAMVMLVEEAIELIERNVHTALVLTVLAHQLGKAMRQGGEDRLYVPLVENPVSLAAY
jgi:DNA polymerase-3 subunit delta'